MSPPSDVQTSASSAVSMPSSTARQRQKSGPGHVGRPYVVPVIDLEPRSGFVAEALYRAFEICVALAGLVVATPILLVAAVLIRRDSPGPALFLHKRPAKSMIVRGRDLEHRTDLRPPPGGYKPDADYFVPRYFHLPKLRTMYSDARARFPHLYNFNNLTPAEFRQQYSHIPNDPRITKVGHILRKLSVDELPNFWSVLVGDVRLVGPRPENPEVLQHYAPEEMYKFVCKPGITGLAQINGRGSLNWGETLAWDLEYIRTRTVALDLKILFITAKHVIERRGAL